MDKNRNEFLSETSKKLTGIVKKINAAGLNMSREKASELKKEVEDVKGSLFAISDIEPDIKHIELFKEGADLAEQLLNTIANPYEHLV
ncbi:hypothetical protein [Methylomonas sp. LL1]|uniref:hypothetical protein n=1 Tax=Methylomonas sp. LL1 TaxID=2785785 RepID=UPI0018C3E6C7|nr:hypothetical protein [Methylomonas sp. LL1]